VLLLRFSPQFFFYGTHDSPYSSKTILMSSTETEYVFSNTRLKYPIDQAPCNSYFQSCSAIIRNKINAFSLRLPMNNRSALTRTLPASNYELHGRIDTLPRLLINSHSTATITTCTYILFVHCPKDPPDLSDTELSSVVQVRSSFQFLKN
jgi:hypothetical protein